MFGAAIVVTNAAQAQQQSTGAVVAGIETPFVRYQRTTSTTPSYDFEYRERTEADDTDSIVSVGLASDALSGFPPSAPIVSTHVGYAFCSRLLLALRVGAGYGSTDRDDGKYWSLLLGPRGECVFGAGWFRPFAGLDLAFMTAGTTTSGQLGTEQTAHLWTIGPTGGLYLFASTAVAFDRRVTLTYGTGAINRVVELIPPGSSELVPGSELPPAEDRYTADVSQLDAVLGLGLSAWL